ncbi:hypothetical protein ACFL2I_08130 [Candidatus Omnitrophota bacterium]
MKTKLIIAILSLFLVTSSCPLSYGQDTPKSKQHTEIRILLRNEFQKALTSSKETKRLISIIEKQYPAEPDSFPATILAYYGALQGLRAKHAFIPTTKFKYLIKSLKFLDASVKKSDADLETFFLRFSSLHHLPSLLSIPKKRREDIEKICALLSERNYRKVDQSYQLVIIEFMIQSKRLSKEQLKNLMILREELKNFTEKIEEITSQ